VSQKGFSSNYLFSFINLDLEEGDVIFVLGEGDWYDDDGFWD